ncbi:nuclear envelope phosphatase-regulatory subunit 1-like [Pocillopora verrucosa]|uniref:Transmembrane protein 188 n=1 Tax=Pocillopora damicornis TaxID=46731 RepID=A0A3M6TI38_POCDA|nr:nuclear envelope phosphatase-regulatory subunit 1-like [Pocillopora damicornis]XP_058949347.1 nuclear envelope phosphatase-regulatory subunit 1-like [Pocillopora verrucosa]RMX40928.1 hypothetical protein pdam_00017655 [Pocillopora damicornis]
MLSMRCGDERNGSSVMASQQVTEDLKAFERRLTEYVQCLGPQTGKWRLILVLSSVATAAGAWGLITDNQHHPSLLQYLWHHKFFTISCCNLFILFMLGIHRRVMAPQIILARTRVVLEDYNMSCDEKGRLILRPRPS